MSLLEDVTTTPIQDTIDTTNGVFGALDLDQVDRLHQPWFGGQERGVEDATGCRDDLATSAMDGVSVECHVVDVETDSAQVLIAEHTLNKEN